MHRLQELVRLHRLGHGAAETAKLLGMARKTERKYRKRLRAAGLLEGPADDLPDLAGLRAAVATETPTPPQERSSVEPWADFVAAKVAQGLGPTAIHELLGEERTDYVGSLSAIKRLTRRLKNAAGPRPEDVAIPVVTVAGQQAQIDFGFVGTLYDPQTRRMRKAWVFVMVLSHSRHVFARVVFRQDLDTWIELHRAAFAAFGGVPAVLVPDNLKAAVVRAAFSATEMGTLNRSYRELARHYGFAIDPTPAFAPQKKGKVESAVKYLKRAFFKPRTFRDVDQANAQLTRWIRDRAGQRIHGTTGRQPLEVFEAEERAALRALPAAPYVPVLWHQATVGRNCHVSFQRRFYSVPWRHVGRAAWLRVRGESLTIYVDDARVAVHSRTGATPWSTQDVHLPEGRRDYAKRDPEHWFARADAIDERVGTYIRAVMASDEVHYPLRRVQSMVRMLEDIEVPRARAACARAARYGCYRPDGLRRILAKGLDQQSHDDGFIHPEWAADPRFARDAHEFLQTWEGHDGHVG